MTDIINAKVQDLQADLDTLLGEITSDFKISIKREEPDWCAGNLGTFHFDRGEAISTDWIANRFGGDKFQIRIFQGDGTPIGSRRIRIPLKPRREGVDLVRSPDGPITVDEAKVLLKPEAPRSSDPMVNMLEKVLAIQAANATQQMQQYQMMQESSMKRTEQLENMLFRLMTTPPTAPATALAAPPTPQEQINNTLSLVQGIDDLRGAVGGESLAQGELDSILTNPLLEKVVDRLITPKTQQQGPPPGYQQQAYQQQPGQPPAQELSNLELANLAKERLQHMTEEEKSLVLSHILADEGEEEDETPDNGQDDGVAVESLLTAEDVRELNDAATTENEAEPEPAEGETV